MQSNTEIGKAAVDVDLLREIGDVAVGEAEEVDRAVERLDLAHQAFEQRRLAGAVRTDKREQLALRHLARHVMHGGMAVIAEGQIAKLDGGGVAHGQARAQ